MTNEPETYSLADLPPDSIREDWTERDLAEHLDGLPQRVLVGFALRCADRIRVLYPHFQQLRRKRAYDFCRDETALTDRSGLFLWDGVRIATLGWWIRLEELFHSVDWAEALPEGGTVPPRHHGDIFSRVSSESATAALKAAEHADRAMNSRDLPSARLMRRAIWIDLVRFTAFGRAVRSDDPLGPTFDPLDESKFGPLWPEGRPTGWPAEAVETPAFADRQPDAAPIGDDLRGRLADWNWINAEVNAGRLEEYRGKHVAVIDGKVLAAGADPLKLRAAVVRKHKVPAERIVTSYIDAWE